MRGNGMDGIKSLAVENFTAFESARLEFGGLNVVSGHGKTHLLKLLYCIVSAACVPGGPKRAPKPSASKLGANMTGMLAGTFRPDGKIGNLARHGRGRCRMAMQMQDRTSLEFSFAGRSTKAVAGGCPDAWSGRSLVFLPANEVISAYPGFRWLYERYDTAFDRTAYDACSALGAPPLRHATESDALRSLHAALGGKVEFDNIRFCLRRGRRRIGMHMLSNGERKAAQVARLADTGHLGAAACMFLDEPDAGLHEGAARAVAGVISGAAESGVQAFVSTRDERFARMLGDITRFVADGRTVRRVLGP